MSQEENSFYSNFFSRQIGTIGQETMTSFSKKNIFIYGMRGVGVETAKNIILLGPRKLIIYDNEISKINDLTANCFISEQDVKEKKRRDEASLKNLSQLNLFIKLDRLNNGSIIDHLKENIKDEKEKYDVIVITEFMPKNDIIEINNFCRNNNIGFIYGSEFGINIFCFTDFGNDFIVHDINGEQPKRFTINSISKGNPGIVNLVHPLKSLDLKNDDFVIFKEIQGMKELNNCQAIKIKIIDKYNIQICDTSKFSNYIGGGVVMRAKIPLSIKFSSFEKKIEEPYDENEIPQIIDETSSNEIIHIGILALYSFYNKYNYLPEINNQNHAKELVSMANKILKEKEQNEEFWIQDIREENINFDILFEKTIKNLSLWSRIQISPISSFLGGVIAHEIIKCTGKYMPLNQWLWLNFNWAVDKLEGKKIDRTLEGSRYDDQIAIFGKEIQRKIENSNIFMTGAGALGCEYLKIFSLMGISTNKNKKYNVTVTDNDNIVISNLNRQFLFRKDNIGKSKSKVACERIKNLNNAFNCIDMQARIGEENENIFNEKFWKSQTFVINAVDNIEARIYIADKCKRYKKILIDSGTNGAKANSQVIIPYKTIDYSPSDNNSDNQIPMCTLRNFPTSIEHCIEWARDNFNGYFIDIINDVKLFIENKDKFYLKLSENYVPSDQIIKLNKIIRYIKMLINKDFIECLKIALEQYNYSFYSSIIHTLYKNPPDSLNEDGTKFWSGDKRCPKPLPFDIENKLIFLFIKKYAQILANSMSIPLINDDQILKEKINEISPLINSESIKENIKFDKEKYFKNKEKNKEELKQKIKSEEIKLIKIKEELDYLNLSYIIKEFKNIFINQEFEKDDDENGHVDFIFASANLRAEIFQIEKCDKMKVRLIAGKIIPAIATTTSSIVGLASLQLFSLYQSNDIKYLRDNYFNLSIRTFNSCPPGKYEEDLEKNQIKSNKIKKIFQNFIQYSKNGLFKILKI